MSNEDEKYRSSDFNPVPSDAFEDHTPTQAERDAAQQRQRDLEERQRNLRNLNSSGGSEPPVPPPPAATASAQPPEPEDDPLSMPIAEEPEADHSMTREQRESKARSYLARAALAFAWFTWFLCFMLGPSWKLGILFTAAIAVAITACGVIDKGARFWNLAVIRPIMGSNNALITWMLLTLAAATLYFVFVVTPAFVLSEPPGNSLMDARNAAVVDIQNDARELSAQRHRNLNNPKYSEAKTDEQLGIKPATPAKVTIAEHLPNDPIRNDWLTRLILLVLAIPVIPVYGSIALREEFMAAVSMARYRFAKQVGKSPQEILQQGSAEASKNLIQRGVGKLLRTMVGEFSWNAAYDVVTRVWRNSRDMGWR